MAFFGLCKQFNGVRAFSEFPFAHDHKSFSPAVAKLDNKSGRILDQILEYAKYVCASHQQDARSGF